MERAGRRGWKLQTSYFLTYLAVLLIPVLVAWTFYSESYRTIQESIESENQSLIRQTRSMLDIPLQDVRNFGAQLAGNASVTALRDMDSPLTYPDAQLTARVQGTLPSLDSASSFLWDYYLFFNRGSLALNDRNACSYTDFYTLFLCPAGQTLAEWENGLRNLPYCSGRCAVLSAADLSGETERDVNLITLTYSLLPYIEGDGQLVLFVDQERLITYLQSFELDEGDIAYIESDNGVIVASVGPEAGSAEALQSFLLSQSRDTDLMVTPVNGKNMMISSSRSQQTGFSLTIARAAEHAYARLRRIRLYIWIASLAAVLLGGLFSYFFSLRSSRLVQMLGAGSSTPLTHLSYQKAFRLLRSSFQDIQSANQQMETALDRQQPILRRDFLIQLLNGDFTSEAAAQSVARGLSCEIEAPIRVVLIHFSTSSAQSGEAMDLQLAVSCKAVIRLAVESLESSALRMSRSESDFVILLWGGNLEDRIEKLVSLIRTNLPEGINEFVYVYVGNAVNQLTEVVRSCDNAASMIYLQPSPAEVPVQYYRKRENPPADIFYPPDIRRRLINAVMNADTEGTLAILNPLREQNLQGTAKPDYIARLLIDSLLSTLLQINSMSGLPPEKTESILSGINAMMKMPLNVQLDMVNTLYCSLCSAIRQLKAEEGKPQIIEEISAYIGEHYTDPDLSLISVADRFHVSESYLSFTFKAQKGINFFSYVEELRIAHAKKLLRETGLKISEIAEQVGYASANSFCRAFRRSTGESASNYRNGAG
ncbi:MAG: AraC family transcriptional regulator [Clostridia bacterium]|nr:AraC family transcriptional regulator [Clostridia bacterium]